LHYCVHDFFSFQITGNCEAALSGLSSDYSFFRVNEPHSDGPTSFTLELNLEKPDYEAFPEVTASVYTPRNVVYHADGLRILDFGGRGLGILDANNRTYRVSSLDPDLVYEAAYLFLLAEIGAAADRRGWTRLHAMSLVCNGRAVHAVLPMGGGKSTLGLALLTATNFGILSDDSPFIDSAGRAHAFPLRLGLLPGNQDSVPQQYRRLLQRMEFGPKYVVDPAYFADRIRPMAEPGLLLIGRRSLSLRPRITTATYREAMTALFPAMILGLGLFQGLEFILRNSAGELLGKFGTVMGRARRAHALAHRSKCFIVYLGRDSEANAAAVAELAERELGSIPHDA
jgi:hypothetical protein